MSIFKRILLACLAILAVGAAQTVFLWVKASRLGAEVDVVTSVPVSPFSASAISALPSGLFTATTGILGLRGRSSRSGVPQMEVQMPQWMSTPGLMAMTPTAPFCSNSRILPGNANPSEMTILPRIRASADRAASWFLLNSVAIDFEYCAGT